jgi:hypothetical protein
MRVTSRTADETLFVATLSDPPFHGEVGASTYVIGPLSDFFREMAEAWSGWDGVKRWAALDGELCLSATMSSLGHVRLAIEIAYLNSAMTTSLTLEAGSLEKIALDVADVFDPDFRFKD